MKLTVEQLLEPRTRLVEMKWYEDRAQDEMPEYLEFRLNQKLEVKFMVRVKKWEGTAFTIYPNPEGHYPSVQKKYDLDHTHHDRCWWPGTEEGYKTFYNLP